MRLLPKNTKAKTLARLDELIERGVALLGTIEVVPAFTGEGFLHTRDRYYLDQQQYAAWRTNCLSILHLFETSPAKIQIETFRKLRATSPEIEHGIGILRGLRNDLEGGHLDALELKIEVEISGDYLGQAEQLLQEGRQGFNEHVPAAVLAGAVLEKAMRSLCSRQQPPVAVNWENGEPKTLNPLIDALKAAGVYNETKAKQLRAWAGIRNDAAHGDFDKFKKHDVELMLKGVAVFLAEYMDAS